MLIHVRESHIVACEACGFIWDGWDTSISLDEAVADAEEMARGAAQVGRII